MQYILIILMCVLSTAKVSVQTAFGKNAVKNSADSALFNALIFVFTSLCFAGHLFGCPPAVWIFGVIYGFLSMLFQLTYTKALSVGNVSLTVMISNLSIVIPVAFSAIVYSEPISVLRFFGIVLTVLSFIMGNNFTSTSKTESRWLVLAVGAALASSAAYIVQKVFSKTAYGSETQAFVSTSYIAAAIIAFTVFGFMNKKVCKKTFKLTGRVFLFAAGTGVSLSLFQAVNTYALGTLDATFLLPTYAGSSLIVSSLVGIFIFKDKLQKKQVFGLITSVAAVVLNSL